MPGVKVRVQVSMSSWEVAQTDAKQVFLSLLSRSGLEKWEAEIKKQSTAHPAKVKKQVEFKHKKAVPHKRKKK